VTSDDRNGVKPEKPSQVEAVYIDVGRKMRTGLAREHVLNLRNILIVLTFGGGLLCYTGVFLSLVSQWRSNEVYSHGFLIPFIALYLVYFKWDSIAERPLEPNYAFGIPAVAISLMCLLAGRIAGILVLEEISIVLSIGAMLLLLFGRSLLRAVWFPVAYLFLMIPMWDIFTDTVQHPFQLLSASIGVEMMNWIGIPVYHNGIFIELPGITLEVAKACSGINYLISILAIGIPLSYINTRRFSRRILILLSSVVIALLSNGIRVFLVGLFVQKGNLGSNHDIHGPFHVLQALSVSFVGYLAIFVLVWLLKDENPPFREARKISRPMGKSFLDHLHSWPLAICAILLAAYGGLLAFVLPTPSPLKKEFGKFPYAIGDWKGSVAAFDLTPYCKKKADRELFRKYQSGYSQPVNLYVGYYELQNQGKELIDYTCDFLFNGGNSITLAMGHGKTIRVNRYVTVENGTKTISLYWVQVDGRILRDKYSEKYYTLMNAFLHHKTNGAIVIVSMEVPNENETAQAMESQAEFVRRIYPLLQEYLP
jgi:EpsI family protein